MMVTTTINDEREDWHVKGLQRLLGFVEGRYQISDMNHGKRLFSSPSPPFCPCHVTHEVWVGGALRFGCGESEKLSKSRIQLETEKGKSLSK